MKIYLEQPDLEIMSETAVKKLSGLEKYVTITVTSDDLVIDLWLYVNPEVSINDEESKYLFMGYSAYIAYVEVDVSNIDDLFNLIVNKIWESSNEEIEWPC